jgi:hypothetical protein
MIKIKTLALFGLLVVIDGIRAQSIHVIGNPKTVSDEILKLLENMYFNKKGLNVSRVDIYYSHKDDLPFNEKNILKRTIRNKKNWKFQLDTFIQNNGEYFSKSYTENRIANAMVNINRRVKSSYVKKIYINTYIDDKFKPLEWINVNRNQIGPGLITKRELISATIIINGIPQQLDISVSKPRVSIMRGSILEVEGLYLINIGRPEALEFKIAGVHDAWQVCQSSDALNFMSKTWKLGLPSLMTNGLIEIRIKGLNGAISNAVKVEYLVLNEPFIELLFPTNRGQLANCPNKGLNQYYMKIKSNVDPNYLVMRLRKNYSGDFNEVDRESESLMFKLDRTNRDIRVDRVMNTDVYCLFLQCPIFFRVDSQDRDAFCKDCINPYDVWSIDFKVNPDKGMTSSDWSRVVEVSLVSFEKDSANIFCPCE